MRHPILFVCLLMISCTIKPSQEEKSRVIEFTYGGFGDTIYATLEGYVRSQATKTPFDSMPPLKDVEITVEQTNQKVLTDEKGYFSIATTNSVYNLIVRKKGYQPLRIMNYASVDDQFSMVDVILEKGSVLQEYRIPDWKK